MPASISKKPSDRTHEENQERAYIAASRRSDRSVEARVESARRASEIHKRRTGKALRITEKDVLAEEMYEEEEDELPSQYKNLNAHLQTGSTDFDARLQAYLANAVAFRKALSGVTKNRDKSNNVDFVNTKQLADHEALFPKHSDAWKNVVIPKVANPTGSPFLPQDRNSIDARRHMSSPYDAKSSALSSRRLSASSSNIEPINSMGTLRPSDLKPRTNIPYRPAPRHPSLPQPKMSLQQQQQHPQTVGTNLPYDEGFEHAGINYASLDTASMSSMSPASVLDSPYSAQMSPFSAQLPANAMDLLLPWNQPQGLQDDSSNDSFLFDGSLFHPRQEDTIDATLLLPAGQKAMPPPSVQDEEAYMQQTSSFWHTNNSFNNNVKESSANRKLAEDSMWGRFIDETTAVDPWDWA